MKQLTKPIIVALTAIAAFFAGLAWYQYNRAEKAQDEIDLNATRMISEIFTAKRDLRVGQISGVIVASSSYNGRIFHPSQRTKAPVTVNYLLDLRKIKNKDMNWDADARRLTVRIPDVQIESPNIDFMRAQVDQKGLWIGRGAGIVMQRQAVERIVGRATERAQDSKNIAIAREQAVKFVQELVGRPLEAVGYGPVEVRVLTPWDASPSAERWNVSRSLEEVFADGA